MSPWTSTHGRWTAHADDALAMRELGAETLGKVKELLNEDQKAKWEELTGEPFELRFGGGPRGGRAS